MQLNNDFVGKISLM